MGRMKALATEIELALEEQMNSEVKNWLILCNFAIDGEGYPYTRDFRGTESALLETIARMECPGGHTYKELRHGKP